jgi:hypothetical protein
VPEHGEQHEEKIVGIDVGEHQEEGDGDVDPEAEDEDVGREGTNRAAPPPEELEELESRNSIAWFIRQMNTIGEDVLELQRRIPSDCKS